jgi:hypothetical protein
MGVSLPVHIDALSIAAAAMENFEMPWRFLELSWVFPGVRHCTPLENLAHPQN